MPSTTNLIIKDGAGSNKNILVLDQSGNGSGPLVPLHLLADKNGTLYDASNPLLTRDQPLGTTLTDGSATVTTGGTAQQALASNASRKFLMITNPSTSFTFWFNTTGTATSEGAGSTQVGPGAAFIFDKIVPNSAISILGMNTGQPFTVKEA